MTKRQKTPESSGSFQKVAEGIYQYSRSKSYYARFRHKGTRIFERLGTDKNPCTALPEARTLLREKKNKLEQTDVTKRNWTLHKIIEKTRETIGVNRSEGTIAWHTDYLNKFKAAFASNVKVASVSKHDCELFLGKFKKLAPATVNHIIIVMREVFAKAIEEGCIDSSPMEKGDGIKYRKSKAKPKRLTPDPDSFKAIVKSIRDQVYADTASSSADLVEFMGLAGLGTAECAGLCWRDINLKSETIVVQRKKTGVEFQIPIYPQLLPFLERLDNERENRDPDANVFTVKNPKKALEAACKRLELPDYTSRALRRMFITQALERGIDAQTIADWQGHTDGGVLILKTYGKVTSKHKRDMAALMTFPPANEGKSPADLPQRN